MEEMHIERVPEGEREEIRQIFRSKGFEGDVLEKIVKVITEDRQQWVDTMLTEEWGLPLRPPSPWRAGLTTLAAFVLVGLIPLLPVMVLLGGEAGSAFIASTVLTGMAFLVVGFIRGRVVDHRPLASAIETLLIGGSAAAMAFIVGRMLEGLASS
jgi:VIT1/CCC1 family predicted Fe2+/Mn2+ transporter